MMFVSGVFSRAIAEYRVLVFPDPVGPVTSTIPYGFKIAFSNLTSDSDSKPSLVISSRRFSLSSNRSTIFSPHNVGSVLTRKSNCFFLPLIFIFSMMRPSCGSRFSLMSSLAMILSREVIASFNFKGGDMIDCRTPSIRNRTRNSFSYGSI